jgi:RNA polymerase sigma factor (sigma-70 family)
MPLLTMTKGMPAERVSSGPWLGSSPPHHADAPEPADPSDLSDLSDQAQQLDDEAREQLIEQVRRALGSALTDKQREVIELHFYEGLSQGQIARRLGITQQVVHKRLHGASRGGKLVGGAISKLRGVLAPIFAPSYAPCEQAGGGR